MWYRGDRSARSDLAENLDLTSTFVCETQKLLQKMWNNYKLVTFRVGENVAAAQQRRSRLSGGEENEKGKEDSYVCRAAVCCR
jgi:hypothetical protein